MVDHPACPQAEAQGPRAAGPGGAERFEIRLSEGSGGPPEGGARKEKVREDQNMGFADATPRWRIGAALEERRIEKFPCETIS